MLLLAPFGRSAAIIITIFFFLFSYLRDISFKSYTVNPTLNKGDGDDDTETILKQIIIFGGFLLP